jgi:hypothetical protein
MEPIGFQTFDSDLLSPREREDASDPKRSFPKLREFFGKAA